MLKKITAITLVLIVMLQPMAASAVTWSALTAGLAASGTGSYASEGTTITKDGDTTTVTGGEVEFSHNMNEWISEAGVYVFSGIKAQELIAGTGVGGGTGKIVLVVKDGSQIGNLTADAMGAGNCVELNNSAVIEGGYIAASSGGTSTVLNEKNGVMDEFTVYTYGGNGSEAVFSNAGVIGNALADGNVTFTNQGTVEVIDAYAGSDSVVYAANASGDGHHAIVENLGTATEIYGYAYDGGEVTIKNGGTAEYMNATAGENGTAVLENAGTATDVYANAYQGGEVTVKNNEGSTVTYLGAGAGVDGTAVIENKGTINELYGNASDNGSTVVTNDGKVLDFISVGVYGEEGTGSVKVSGKGENQGDMYAYVDMFLTEGTEIPTAEALAEIAAKALQIDLSQGLLEYCEVYLYNEDGELIDENGNVVDWEEYEPILVTVEQPESDYVEPDFEAYYAELRRQDEALRQSRAVGGVTTSIFWNYQMYLGHSTYNGRVFYQGEKALTYQSLNWLPDGTKNYTLRINENEPAAADVEIRVAQDILDVCERAGISTITLVDKEEIPFAQFAVADLIAARELYALAEDELLCVSADANAEVMKVTSAGEYLPLEPEAETEVEEKTAG